MSEETTGRGWVFGYGSLMWEPGFACQKGQPALLKGYHRRYCMYSIITRGTPEEPGIMLGVLPGGECVGTAFSYDRAKETEVLDYLDNREGEGRANRRVMLPVQLLGNGNGQTLINAWSYLPLVSYEHYVGSLDQERIAELITKGKGKNGTAREYFNNLLTEVRRLEVKEDYLENLGALVSSLSSASAD